MIHAENGYIRRLYRGVSQGVVNHILILDDGGGTYSKRGYPCSAVTLIRQHHGECEQLGRLSSACAKNIMFFL